MAHFDWNLAVWNYIMGLINKFDVYAQIVYRVWEGFDWKMGNLTFVCLVDFKYAWFASVFAH